MTVDDLFEMPQARQLSEIPKRDKDAVIYELPLSLNSSLPLDSLKQVNLVFASAGYNYLNGICYSIYNLSKSDIERFPEGTILIAKIAGKKDYTRRYICLKGPWQLVDYLPFKESYRDKNIICEKAYECVPLGPGLWKNRREYIHKDNIFDITCIRQKFEDDLIDKVRANIMSERTQVNLSELKEIDSLLKTNPSHKIIKVSDFIKETFFRSDVSGTILKPFEELLEYAGIKQYYFNLIVPERFPLNANSKLCKANIFKDLLKIKELVNANCECEKILEEAR